MAEHAGVEIVSQVPPALEAGRVGLSLAKASFLVAYRGNTRQSYALSLDLWFRWCAERSLDPLAGVTRVHMEAYGLWQDEVRGLRPGTVALRLSVLSCFYRHLEITGLAERNAAAGLRLPRVPSESPTVYIDRDALAALVDASRRDPAYHLLVCLLGLSGLRVSEALKANMADLGQIGVHRTLAVLRKGGRAQVMPLPPVVMAAVEAATAGRSSGPLIVSSRTGGRMSRSNAYQAVRRLAREAGIDPRCHPHALRHCFVTCALDAGASLRDVQDSAGHADPRTTGRYDYKRNVLDRNVSYLVADYVVGETDG